MRLFHGVPVGIKAIMIVLFRAVTFFHFDEFRYGRFNVNEIMIVLITRLARSLIR